jgi:hypothetical protein
MQDGDRRREIRHNLRGAYHTLRLCIMVLDGESDREESLTWLGHIEQAADDCVRYVAAMDELPDETV